MVTVSSAKISVYYIIVTKYSSKKKKNLFKHSRLNPLPPLEKIALTVILTVTVWIIVTMVIFFPFQNVSAARGLHALHSRATHPPIPMMNFILKLSQTRVDERKVVDYTTHGSVTVRRNAWKEKVEGNVSCSTPPWRWMKAGRWRFLAIFHQRETRALAAAETLPAAARWLAI